MIDQNKYTAILINILKDIYTNPEIRKVLGFKGGTAVYLFYNLPRMSVDLGFDLLKPEAEELVFSQMQQLLAKHGIKDATRKRFTIFLLLSYRTDELKVKVEISKRKTVNQYEQKSYLGISMLVATKKTLITNKFCALLNRTKFAARDTYDLWYMLQQQWELDERIINHNLEIETAQAVSLAIDKVENIKQNQLLQGIGELFDQSTKDWVRNNLKQDLLFQLRLQQRLLK